MIKTPEVIWLTPEHEDRHNIVWQSNQPMDHENEVAYIRADVLHKYITSQPTVQADARCRCNSETYDQCMFYDGDSGCVHPPRTA